MILAMSYALMVSALIAIAAHALERAGRGRIPARWFWCAALIAMVGVSLLSLVGPRTSGARNADPAVALSGEPLPRGADAPTLGLKALRTAGPVVVLAWAGTSLAMMALFVAANLRIAGMRRSGTRVELQSHSVLLTERDGPAAAGVFRPFVVVPRWALSLDHERQRLLLVHEAEHLRAGDPRLLWIAALALVLLPWNVALWWTARRLALAVEMDCDARVLSRTSELRAYAELLLLAAARRTAVVMVPLARFPTSNGQLRRRIDAITKPGDATLGRRAMAVIVAVVALAAACDAPRPDPVAPIYDLRGASGAYFASSERGSDMGAFVEYLRRTHPRLVAPGTDRRQPLIRILASDGRLLRVLRASPNAMTPDSLRPERIRSIEVVKGSTLPPVLRGGLITITMKLDGESPAATPGGEARKFSESPPR